VIDAMADQAFLGIGWRFPVQVEGPAGGGQVRRIATSAYEESIEEAMRLILGTARGERLMRPDFGSELHRLVFAPNTTATAGLAIFYVQQALRKWEPRVVLLAVDANPNPEPGKEAELLITVSYKVIATNNERNLVYPFYLVAQ
jgi:phage baseplate assembly protein W